ncbi:MAG: primosomal protein N' [Candidatus Poribacteria bacterium]|nr:primosomal protein N' [Candidatus Poribacteria bacterium]
MSELYAAVAFPTPVDKLFSYRVPEELVGAVQPGCRVTASLRGRRLEGVAAELRTEAGVEAPRVLPLLSCLDESPFFSREMLELCRWVGDYYLCSWGEALAAASPSSARRKPRRPLGIRLAVSSEQALEQAELKQKKAPKQAALLEYLCRQFEPIPAASAVQAANASYATARALQAQGLAIVEPLPEESALPPEQSASFELSDSPLQLNPEQAAAYKALRAAVLSETASRFLLYGVTGSGKTEVYMQAMQEAVARGRSALVLVPEIALTPQTSRRLRARFGDRVAVLHSGLSGAKRRAEWMRIRRGEADIVVGPRSAVFAPLSNLGILIIDEEHAESYKQQEPAPRYHARETARRRAEQANACLILGSATPSLESMRRAIEGDDQMLRLKKRVLDIPLPPVRVIDMREELKAGNRTPFSRELRSAIEKRLKRREQTLLLLNRRGHSTYVFCRDCGQPEICKNCHITLTYHDWRRLLMCHHCSHTRRMPERCGRCGSARIRQLGLGTQQIEQMTQEAFPTARVQRMDADSTSGRDSHARILSAFRSGEIDILVGTQMIAKGLDFPRVTLVGVILAETALHLPDFRASERTFNLLTQAAGRSGRGELGGEAIFQSYQPGHCSIEAASRHDYEAFQREEMEARSEYRFPPFTHALRFLIMDEIEEKTKETAYKLGDALKAHAEETGVVVKGPAPARFSKLRNQFRWHLFLCHEDARALRQAARAALQTAKGPASIVVDMDPISAL